MFHKLFQILSALAFSAAAAVHAHTVWIEPAADGRLVVRFTEPGSAFETSPGHLDGLSAPIVFTLAPAGPAPLGAPKKSDHFLLEGVSSTNIACAESSFTVRGGRKPIFYARWQPAGLGAGTPLLTFDLVPTGKAGEVRAWFRGKPLGGITATLRTPDEMERELTADAEGFLRFESNQSGLHLLTIAHHREPLAGLHGGRSYEQTSHNTALTWRQ